MTYASLIAQAPGFAALPAVEGGFSCVTCGAGIYFNTWSAKSQSRAPSRHYRDHSPKALTALLLLAVLARDAWMFLWWPDPHLPTVTDVMRTLGFEFSGKAFTWIKTLASLAQGPRLTLTDRIESALHPAAGFTTRKNSETCWLRRCGKPQILSHSVRGVIVAPGREHFRKPSEFYRRVDQFCPESRLDLFGRQSRRGWIVYSDEATLFDTRSALISECGDTAP
jgi:N6-adenosine-specific RNA methylase IME4